MLHWTDTRKSHNIIFQFYKKIHKAPEAPRFTLELGCLFYAQLKFECAFLSFRKTRGPLLKRKLDYGILSEENEGRMPYEDITC